MEVINIVAKWSSNYFKNKKIINKMKENSDIIIKEYDYDYDLEKIKYFNIAPYLPVIIFINNEKEVARLTNPDFSDINILLKKFSLKEIDF